MRRSLGGSATAGKYQHLGTNRSIISVQFTSSYFAPLGGHAMGDCDIEIVLLLRNESEGVLVQVEGACGCQVAAVTL